MLVSQLAFLNAMFRVGARPRQLRRYAARKRRSSETVSLPATLQVTDSCVLSR